MKRKLLATVLSTAMVATSLTGCGTAEGTAKKDDSSYFKEMKEMASVNTGTSTTEMTFNGKVDEAESIADILDADGKVNVSLKVETKTESADKSAVVISAKYGTQSDYSEVTTMVLSEGTLYANVKPVIDLVSNFSEETATAMTTSLASMGITDYVSVKVDTVVELLEQSAGEEFNMNVEEYQDDAVKFVNEVCDILAKDFADISGKDGEDYTLTLDKDNAEKVITCAGKLINNDAEKIYDSFVEFAKVLYGEDSDIIKEFTESKEQNISDMKDAIKKEIEDKDEFVKTVEDNDISVISKIKVDGKEGERTGLFAIDASMNSKLFTELSDTEGTYKLSIKEEFDEAKVTIDDLVPQDAVDITVLLTSALSGYAARYGAIEDADYSEYDDVDLEDMDFSAEF